MKIDTDPKKIKEVLERGVEEVIVKKHLEKRLRAGKKLRVKFGIDPTSADLHLGHSIPLQKLRQFQELGHQVIFLIGDFTAQIGDPSARVATRKPLKEQQIRQNMRDYIRQASKVLDFNKVEIRYNSEWYKKKGIDFLMKLSSHFTYARLIERKEFKKRIKKGIDVSMLELLYPLLQGYDSVELKADVEIGGTDQKFNLVFGRKVQKKYNISQQDIITLSLLIGTDGSTKMSKSFNNYIKLTEKPSKMFGQIMSIPDTLIWHYFDLLTDLPRPLLPSREAKARLAKEIVNLYYNKKEAQKAEREFNRIFKEKKLPSKVPIFKTSKKVVPILDLIFDAGLTQSKSQAKRLISGRGVKINGKTKTDWREKIKIKDGMIIKVGKRKFRKIKL